MELFFRCKELIILETYTTLKNEELQLPPFLELVREVTADKEFSMYNLSKKEESIEEKKRRQLNNLDSEISSIPNGHA